MNVRITVRYFALLRQRRQLDRETLEIEPLRVKDLYCKLSEKYQFGLDHDLVKTAVNGEYVSDNYVIKDGEEIVYIPPVSGG